MLTDYVRKQSLFRENNSDSVLFYINKALPIAEQYQQLLDIAQLKIGKAYQYYYSGRIIDAYEIARDAQQMVEKAGNNQQSWVLGALGRDLDGQKSRISVLAGTHLILGHLVGEYDTDAQLVHYRTAFEMSNATSSDFTKGMARLNLGISFSTNSIKLDSALLVLDSALFYMSRNGDAKYLGMIVSTKADVLFRKKQPDSALYYFREALHLNSYNKSEIDLIYVYYKLSQLYLTNGRLDSAMVYANSALQKLENLQGFDEGSVINKGKVYEVLAKYYFQRGDKDSAFFFQEKATGEKENLFRKNALNANKLQSKAFNNQIRLQELEQERQQTIARIRVAALIAGMAVFVLLAGVLLYSYRKKQQANKILESTLAELKAMQSQLIQSEKMASLGQLTAGIAHEIQNPLNFVNNFAEVNSELLEEAVKEMNEGSSKETIELLKSIRENEEKIAHHGKRADAIVKGMLQHSRSGSGHKELTDLNSLTDEYIRLCYHGIRAKDNSFNATIKADFDQSLPKVKAIAQDLGRAILNLLTNAFYTVNEKRKSVITGYEPTVSIETKYRDDRKVEIIIKDNGNGIPKNIIDKIFQPFFTTKPTGQGTGLGLSLAYDIIKAHGGELKVGSTEGKGSEFRIILPV